MVRSKFYRIFENAFLYTLRRGRQTEYKVFMTIEACTVATLRKGEVYYHTFRGLGHMEEVNSEI